MTAPGFWTDPRLQWIEPPSMMREALLWWLDAAPSPADRMRLVNRNADHIHRLPESDRAQIEAAAQEERDA